MSGIARPAGAGLLDTHVKVFSVFNFRTYIFLDAYFFKHRVVKSRVNG